MKTENCLETSDEKVLYAILLRNIKDEEQKCVLEFLIRSVYLSGRRKEFEYWKEFLKKTATEAK